MADERAFSFHWQVRERILPALAQVDGLSDQLPDVERFFDSLCDRDLDFDLRDKPPYASNLCEDDCAIELAYTFGGRDNCGVRYSYEPTCKKSMLKNRYALCRDRVRRTMREAGDGYDSSLFTAIFSEALDNDVLLDPFEEPTATICAIHHYKDRSPRLKMYFSVDYVDEDRALSKVRSLVEKLDAPRLSEQTECFLSAFEPAGGARMLGFDFEPGREVEVKVYKMGLGLDPSALGRLIDDAGGGHDAHAGVAAFQDIFLDGDRDPAAFNLVTLGPAREGPPRLKLYIRPVDLFDDGEALARLRRWFAHLGRNDELDLVERGLSAVCPLDVLDETRGFFNYLSVDVGPGGVSKTSVYFAPLIPLAQLAKKNPKRLLDLPLSVTAAR
jgi:hypothetical protein